MAESGGKPNTCFKESSGDLSCGWFQLSLIDAKIYGCLFNITQDLFDPGKNTDCKNKIAAKLRSKYPDLSYQLTLGKYWAVLRGPEWGDEMRVTAWSNFKREAKKLNCITE